jgi:hypothetical protein
MKSRSVVGGRNALNCTGWQIDCRNIPITLIDLEKGEGKAHACVNAC